MKHRILRIGLFCVCAGMVLPGCEALRHDLRRDSDDDKPAHADSKSDSDSDSDSASQPTASKGFFKSSRLSGAMSSEGREIENDLGIH